MAMITHTVVWGDTLWDLAIRYGTTYQEIARINNIPNPSLIYVGQVLKIKDDGGAPVQPDPIPPNKTYTCNISAFGLQSDTDRTIFATWTFTRSEVEDYSVMWYYDTGDGVWFVGNDGTEKYMQSIYNAPSNAKRVKFKVKPNSKKRTVNGSETTYWNGGWTSEKTYSFNDAPKPPEVPPVPSVSMDKYKFEATLENITDERAVKMEFQVLKNDTEIYATGTAPVNKGHVKYVVNINAGHKYKARVRAVGKDNLKSEWSNYSGNVSSIPYTPDNITSLRGTSATSIYIAWSKVNSAKTYDIEYTTERKYFEGSDQTQTITGITSTSYEKTGLESGKEYFFRVRAVNEQGESSWSGIKSIIIGKDPTAPTTWSSSTTVITGDELILYWVHNSEDGSSQTYSQLELIINGKTDTINIKNDRPEEEKDKTNSYVVDTSSYIEGTKIQWRVRTAGITLAYGEWSIQRIVDVYAPATLVLSLRDNNNNPISTLNEFPLIISGIAGPSTQTPTGYHVTITAEDSYDTTDSIGNYKRINKGDSVFSKYYDIKTMLNIKLSAGDVDFENNINYTVTCIVSMNSGLTAERKAPLSIAWVDEMYQPNAEIGINRETMTTQIRPFCYDENDNPVEGVLLSVYRREFDGSFTLIGDNLDNSGSTFVVDPHPALDYARYRIVATAIDTGAVSFYDVPGYPVSEKAVIIQWDEAWSNFDSTLADENAEPAWTGSMLKLPYNIDVSDASSVDVEHVNYIGRKRPVSYYGTHVDETATWNVQIVADDKETLYAIRRLAIWTGNVYVREPSGSGYWASISVSFSQKHKELTIPVTFNITRVEGGM